MLKKVRKIKVWMSLPLEQTFHIRLINYKHMSHLVDVSQQSITYIGQSDAGRNW